MSTLSTLEANSLKGALEALLLVSSDPVSAPALASALDIAPGECASLLAELKVEYEEANRGFAVSEVRAAAERAKSLSHVVLRGLMTIPPVAEGEHGSVPYFEKVHALYVDINASLYDNKLDILSMGMSGDYEDAVRCGATMVRVGTAIFGARHYTL